MAKVSIYNATNQRLTLKATWATGKESKDVPPFGDNYIDNVIEELEFTVSADNDETVHENSGKISAADSYSFLAYRKYDDDGKLYVGNRHKLTDNYPPKMRNLAKSAYDIFDSMKREDMMISKMRF